MTNSSSTINSPRRIYIFRGLALCLACIFTLAIAEIAARRFFDVQVFRSFDWLKADPDLGWVHRPDYDMTWVTGEFSTRLHFNHQGFRGAQWPAKKTPGRERIAVIGDSFVEGLQVNDDELTTALLPGFMKRDGGQEPEVINMGVSLYGIDQYLWTYEKFARPLKPETVVICVLVSNDFRDSDKKLQMRFKGWDKPFKPFYKLEDGKLVKEGFDAQQAQNIIDMLHRSRRVALEEFFNGHLALYRVGLVRYQRLRYQWTRLRNGEASTDESRYFLDGVPMDFEVHCRRRSGEYEDAVQLGKVILLTMCKEIEADGAAALVVFIPFAPQVYPAQWDKLLAQYPRLKDLGADPDLPETELMQFCKENGMRCLDLLPGFRQTVQESHPKLYYEVDGHFTAAGHRAAAVQIAGAIKNMQQ